MVFRGETVKIEILKYPDSEQYDGEAGFSLIEVLIALAISALAVGMFQLQLVANVQTLELAAERMRAANHAKSTLASLGFETPLVEGRTNGQYEEQMSFVLDVSAVRQPGAVEHPMQLYEVDLNVMWPSGEGAQILRFSTQRLAGGV